MNYIALILSVLLGFLFVIMIKPKTSIIQLFLSFSGAYLLSITVLHLIPDVFETHYKNIGLFILLGILIQTILEFFSKGAEHGHIHAHDFTIKIPWLIFLSLSLHAFLEGLPLGIKSNADLLGAIVIHKIPVAIVLVVFLQKSNLPKKMVYLLVIAFALMSPLGSLIGHEIDFITNYQTQINGVIIGVFLHISTAILFESSENHKFNFKKFIAILMGFLVALTSIWGH